MKKRIGIIFLILSVFFWMPLSFNTTSVSGVPSQIWYFIAPETIECVAISADGNYIVAGNDNGTIFLFEKSNNAPLWEYQVGMGNTITSIAISDDGSYIISGSVNNNVYFFNNSITSPKFPLWSNSSSNPIRAVALSSDGKNAAAISTGGKLSIFDTENISSPLLNSFTETSILSSLAISSDGKYIVCGDDASKVHFYNTSDKLWTYNTFAPITHTFNTIAISSDGEYIVTGSDDYSIYLLNKTFPPALKSPLWSNDTGDDVESVDISSDGSYVASGNSQGNFSLFDKSNSQPLWSHSVCEEIYSVAISGDGNFAVYGGNLLTAAMVYIFGRDNPNPMFSQVVDQNVIDISVAISANGRYVAIGTSGDNNRLYLYEVYSVQVGIDWLLVGGVVLVVGGIAGGLAGVRRRIKKRRTRKKRYKLISGPSISLTPIDILKDVGNKESLLMKFQEAKTAQNISPIKDIVLTPVSAGFVEKVDKLRLEPLEMKEFLEEMLALPPIERNEIIDRMLLVSGGAA